MSFQVRKFGVGVSKTGVTPEFVQHALNRLAPWRRHLPDVGHVNHPVAMPRAWRRGNHFVESGVQYGLRSGWQLARLTCGNGSPIGRTYLLPPEQHLAALLCGSVYGALRAAGLVTAPREVHLPPGFSVRTGTALNHLHLMLDAACLAVNPEGIAQPDSCVGLSVAEVLEAGGILVAFGKDRFLVDAPTLTAIELNHAETDHFANLGLCQVRRATQPAAAPPTPRSTFESRALIAQTLDLEAFASANILRWGSEALSPVVDPQILATTPFPHYPELTGWLTRHLPLIEPSEFARVQSLLQQLEGAESVSRQEGIVDQVKGLLAEITVRPALLTNYRTLRARDPNTLLLLSHQIAAPDGRPASDAILATLGQGANGEPQLILGTIYEIALSPAVEPILRVQLRRALDDRFATGLHLKGNRGEGRTLPVERPDVGPVSLEAWTLADEAAAAIHAVAAATRESAITRMRAQAWGLPQKGTGPHTQQPGAFRPTDPLATLTVAELEQWATRLGSEMLVLRGCAMQDGTISGFAVDGQMPAHLLPSRFAITLHRVGEGNWDVTAVRGPGLRRVLPVLRQVAGLTVPSDEWLSRDLQETRSVFTTVEAFKHLTPQHLDQWASPAEWNTNTLVLRGTVGKDDTILHLAVDTHLPADLSPARFTITLHRADEGDWHVTAVGGQGLPKILPVIHQIAGLTVPSNEWLSRDMHKRYSAFTTLAALKHLTPQHMNQWASLAEWNSNALVLRGMLKRNGTIEGYTVGTKPPTDLGPAYFTIALHRTEEGWKVTALGGCNSGEILPVLRQVAGLTVPSDEWLSRKAKITFSAFTTIEALNSLTPKHFDQWAGAAEWNSDTLVLRGNIRKDVTISAFAVGTEVPAELEYHYFTVTFTRALGGKWRFVARGSKSAHVATALKAAGFVEA